MSAERPPVATVEEEPDGVCASLTASLASQLFDPGLPHWSLLG